MFLGRLLHPHSKGVGPNVSHCFWDLYYCNCLLVGITDGLMRRLQAVQNAAASLITGTRRRDHIIPILRQLHWLSVRQRIELKLAMLVFKTLHGSAPQYLVDDCQLVTASGRRQLRSSDVYIRVSFNALALISVIAPSLSLDHVCGTVSLSVFATSTSPSDSSVAAHLFN